MSEPPTTAPAATQAQREFALRRVAETRLADATTRVRQTERDRDEALERIRQLENAIVHAAAARDAEVLQAEALARHLWRLHRSVRDLLCSRRWRIGRRAGDLVDRLLRRRRAIAEDERILALMDDGKQMLGAVTEDRARRRADRSRSDLAARAGHRNVSEYLRVAVVDPVLHTPFDAGGQHVLDVMDAYREKLLGRWRGRTRGPKVSVVMPTYNRRDVLPRAIGAVLAQSYEDWELVVVDDGSTDGTAEVVGAFGDERIVSVRLPGNGGVSAARNRGLERASGELVAYLDSDNYWDEHYLLLMIAALGEHPGREAIYCAQEIWEVGGEDDDGGAPPRRLDGVRFAPFNRSLLENRNYIDLNAFVHTRSLHERLGGFDEDLPRLVDWDLFLRYTAAARPLALPCVLSVYEFGAADDQLTRTLPVRPATATIDEKTLHREVLDVALSAADAARYRHPTLFAPLGPRRAGTPRPVTVVVGEATDGFRLALCLDTVRRSIAGADVRFAVVDRGAAGARPAAGVAGARDVEVVPVAGANASATLRAGIAAVGAERDVVLLAAAAIVTPGWLEALWEVLDTVPETGVVAPRVVLMPGTPGFAEHVPYAKSYRELDVTLSLREGNVADPALDDGRGLVALHWAPFTCAYLPRATLDAAGLPPDSGDAERAARTYGDLLSTILRRPVVYTPHAKVYHLP